MFREKIKPKTTCEKLPRKKIRQNQSAAKYIFRRIAYPKHKNHIFKELSFPESMLYDCFTALLFQKQLQR